MQANPDTIEGTPIPWGNGPIGQRLVALVWLVVLITAIRTYDLSRREDVLLMILGSGCGLLLSLFDRWWGARPAIHMVDSAPFTDVKRYAPTVALLLVATFVAFRASSDGAWAVFESALFLVFFALVPFEWQKRRAARRRVRLDAIAAGD